MRRGCSAILLVLGGWLLSSIGIVGLMPEDEGVSRWAMVSLFAALAAPFLLIGAWVSPGQRLTEIGLTLMIAAGCAAVVVVTMAAVAFDPAIRRYMPEPLPNFDFTSPAMIGSILLMAAGGYALRLCGFKRKR
jgi:hypothetical protein